MEITETDLNAIQEVAAALRMTVNEFWFFRVFRG